MPKIDFCYCSLGDRSIKEVTSLHFKSSSSVEKNDANEKIVKDALLHRKEHDTPNSRDPIEANA